MVRVPYGYSSEMYIIFKYKEFNFNTYIIGHYNPSVRIIVLVSYTTYVVCVNFIHKLRDLQFNERQIFLRHFSWQFLFTLRVFARNLLRGNCQRNTFRILFWCLAWGACTLAFRLINQLLLATSSRRLQLLPFVRFVNIKKIRSTIYIGI